jgi:hypothetical protein
MVPNAAYIIFAVSIVFFVLGLLVGGPSNQKIVQLTSDLDRLRQVADRLKERAGTYYHQLVIANRALALKSRSNKRLRSLILDLRKTIDDQQTSLQLLARRIEQLRVKPLHPLPPSLGKLTFKALLAATMEDVAKYGYDGPSCARYRATGDVDAAMQAIREAQKEQESTAERSKSSFQYMYASRARSLEASLEHLEHLRREEQNNARETANPEPEAQS